MKKNMILVGLMMVSTIIFAQKAHNDHKEGASKRAEKMKTELSLSDDQFAKTKAINEKFAAEYKALRSDTSITVGTAHRRAAKLRSDRQAQIKTVLTDAQWTKWMSLKSKHGDGRKKRG